MVDNNFGGDYGAGLPYSGYVGDTVAAENTYLSTNNIPEIKYLVLFSLNIGGSKYRICSRKTDTATNITIHKMTERIDSENVLDVTDCKITIHLLLRYQMYSDSGTSQLLFSGYVTFHRICLL